MHQKYKEQTAVNNISFNIEEGELVGYIGENGAGKSTTVKMLTGLLTPTSGKIVVNGIVPNENRIENNKQIGAVFGQKTQLWWDLPVIESFRLIKKMYDIPDGEYRKNLKKFTEILNLEELLEKQVKLFFFNLLLYSLSLLALTGIRVIFRYFFTVLSSNFNFSLAAEYLWLFYILLELLLLIAFLIISIQGHILIFAKNVSCYE